MRYAAEHKQKTRERVLKAAAKAIREAGPDRVAVAGLMAEVGLTHGGFYAHFESKDALVAAAIGEMFADAAGRFARSTQGFSPEVGMTRYLDFYLSPAHRDRRGSGCPVAALAADLPRMEGQARERYGAGVAGLSAKIAGQLQRMGRDDADALAASVVAELVGALCLSRAVADPRQSDAILDASLTALKRRLGLETAA